MDNFFKKIMDRFFVTKSERVAEISETRDISTPTDRDMVSKKLVMESLCCPYCRSTNFVKKGFRMKIREKIQLYLCLSCRKVFTPHATKGKHYPLAIMLDAISIYNLGYSLEQTCRIVSQRFSTKKEAPVAEGFSHAGSNVPAPDTRKQTIPSSTTPVKTKSMLLQPSTLSSWITETAELCRFCRMREYAITNIKLFSRIGANITVSRIVASSRMSTNARIYE